MIVRKNFFSLWNFATAWLFVSFIFRNHASNFFVSLSINIHVRKKNGENEVNLI